MISTNEISKMSRKKTISIVMIILFALLYLFTFNFKSNIMVDGQVMNSLGPIPGDNLLVSNMLIEGNDVIVISVVSDDYVCLESIHSCAIIDTNVPIRLNAISNPTEFTTSIFVTVILLIVPIFCIFYFIIFPRYSPKKEMKDLAEIEPMDASGKKVRVLTEPFEIYENKIIFHFISLGLVSLAVQNISALLLLAPTGIALFISGSTWVLYLWNIPLIFDLLVGLIFTIGFVLVYHSSKNKKAILTSICWILWLLSSVAYRIIGGMPFYDSSNGGLGGGIIYNMALTGFLFGLSQVTFWFAIFMTDLSLRFPKQNLFSKLIWFGSINYFLGILLTYLIIYLDVSVPSYDIGFFIVVALYAPAFLLKTIVPPIVGAIQSIMLYLGLKKDFTSGGV